MLKEDEQCLLIINLNQKRSEKTNDSRRITISHSCYQFITTYSINRKHTAFKSSNYIFISFMV